MVRSSYYLIFGLLSLSNQHCSLSSREEVVQFLSQQAHITSPVKLITAPSAPAELLKMDSVSMEEKSSKQLVWGGLLIFSGDVWLGSPNPDPISDQNI